MHHPAHAGVRAQGGDRVLVGVAAVDDHGLVQLEGQLQVAVEAAALGLARGELLEVVEAGLAHGHALGPRAQLAHGGCGQGRAEARRTVFLQTCGAGRRET